MSFKQAAKTFAIILQSVRFGNTSLKRANTFDVVLQSTFDNEIGFQFLIKLLSLTLSSINLITTCFSEIANFSLISVWFKALIKGFLISSQKVA